MKRLLLISRTDISSFQKLSSKMEGQARRFFIALPVDDEKAVHSLNGILEYLKGAGPVLKIVPPQNYHITLKFFGEVETAKTELLEKAFMSMTNLHKVEYKIAGTGAFPSLDYPSVIWAGMKCDEKPLYEIFNAVENMAALLGFPPEKRKFVPHLTLARVKRETKTPPGLKKYLFEEENTKYCSSVFRELVLFESFLQRTGPEYRKVKIINLI